MRCDARLKPSLTRRTFSPVGNPVYDQQGEMVITKPFPNMPVGFWGPGGEQRYHEAYYEAFPQKKPAVWTHGDWVEVHSLTNGVTVFGRSDGVLNPAGVRFGSAEMSALLHNSFLSLRSTSSLTRTRLPIATRSSRRSRRWRTAWRSVRSSMTATSVCEWFSFPSCAADAISAAGQQNADFRYVHILAAFCLSSR